jgi:c-di-GMP-binding flagellar brake protein YcgR
MSSREKPQIGRRLECRLAACIAIKVRILGCDIPGITHDLSANGILMTVTSPRRFEVGESFPLEVELPSETSIRVEARVARITEPNGTRPATTVAFEFTEIAEDDQARIARFIYRKQIQSRQMGLG